MMRRGGAKVETSDIIIPISTSCVSPPLVTSDARCSSSSAFAKSVLLPPVCHHAHFEVPEEFLVRAFPFGAHDAVLTAYRLAHLAHLVHRVTS
jgi:hypothetical protein